MSSISARRCRPSPMRRAIDAYKVPGCVSQVWLTTEVGDGADPVVSSRAIPTPISCAASSPSCWRCFPAGRASEIVATDAEATLRELGLDEHLTPQRANGLRSMVKRIKRTPRPRSSRQPDK